MNYEHTFMFSLILLGPIVALVMFNIRGDLVLSLGLIGSLSIIRFRTAIKDTRDMVFIFWVIAVGLGSGTYNWSVVLISSVFITIIVFILYVIRYGYIQNKDFILSISGRFPNQTDQVRDIVQKHAINARMRSYEVEDETWEMIYELRLLDATSPAADRLIQELKASQGISHVSLLAPQLALPI
jgi:uncharacterized membrane protein YhiD involved in acid resistance